MYETKFCKISYDEKLNIVLVIWKQFCSGKDYREPLLYALDILINHNGCNFVVDTRDGFENEEGDTQWLLNEFLPKAIKTSCKYVFFIINKDDRLKKELDKQSAVLREYFIVKMCFGFDEIKEELKRL